MNRISKVGLMLIPFVVFVYMVGCGAEGNLCSDNSDCGGGLVCTKANVCKPPGTETKTPEETQKAAEQAKTDGGDTKDNKADEKQPICEDDVAGAAAVVGGSITCYTAKTGCVFNKTKKGFDCKGICGDGAKTCLSKSGKIVWGSCVGETTPRAENTEAACTDKLDNDCDGDVDADDEDCKEILKKLRPECNDDDQEKCTLPDQKGMCANGIRICTNGKWSKCVQQVFKATEICDGKDNDCDGEIDEGQMTRKCYNSQDKGCVPTGNGQFDCKGICATGTQTCIKQRTPQNEGSWSVCRNFVGPEKETCNQKDDNCDGDTDEGNVCTCNNGDTRPCYPSGVKGCVLNTTTKKYDCKGVCAGGIQVCKNNKWSTCQGAKTPTDETCDNVDNNCDGQKDENLFRQCFSGQTGCTLQADGKYLCKGECKSGKSQCIKGVYQACKGEVTPKTPDLSCTKDDNCDGQLSENCACTKGAVQPCYTFNRGCAKQIVGGKQVVTCAKTVACKAGKQTCVEVTPGINRWGACVGEVGPSPEKCDGIDNDCDGTVDGLQRQCYTGKPGECTKLSDGTFSCNGVCRAGTQFCIGGSGGTGGNWGACLGSQTPTSTTEICKDKNDADENCNGVKDESCQCTPGETRSCYGGATGCTKTTVNGKDSYSCTGSCKSGIQRCGSNGKWQATCENEVQPKGETCNNLDDNCNGQTDENLVETCTDSNNTGCVKNGNSFQCKGTCKSGTRTCKQGQWSACNDIRPKVEICGNKVDDDCDGQDDESCTCQPTSKRQCFALTTGCVRNGNSYTCTAPCKVGEQICNNSGEWGTCKGQVLPEDEKCDGKDNNCNGSIDEGCSCKTGEKRSCYTGTKGCSKNGNSFSCNAPCKAGEQVCDSLGKWGSCTGQIISKPEVCDGKDNDCDGRADNGINCSEPKPEPTPEPTTEPVMDGGTEPTPEKTSEPMPETMADAGTEIVPEKGPESTPETKPDTSSTKCNSNADCSGGKICSVYTSKCETPQCNTTADCQALPNGKGTVCKNRFCKGCANAGDCSQLQFTTCNTTTRKCEKLCQPGSTCSGINVCINKTYTTCKAADIGCACLPPTCVNHSDCSTNLCTKNGSRKACQRCTRRADCSVLSGSFNCVNGKCQ